MITVETKNLVKQYGKTTALKGLDFTLDEKEIMVLLGPNGSGKTTLLLILATVLKPTSGIAATLAAFASTHGEFFFAFQQVVQSSLLTFSTVFYPIEVIQNYLPPPLVTFAAVNPLSQAAEAIRQFAFSGLPIQPWFLANMLFASIPFALLGAIAYFMALRTMQAKGKL